MDLHTYSRWFLLLWRSLCGAWLCTAAHWYNIQARQYRPGSSVLIHPVVPCLDSPTENRPDPSITPQGVLKFAYVHQPKGDGSSGGGGGGDGGGDRGGSTEGDGRLWAVTDATTGETYVLPGRPGDVLRRGEAIEPGARVVLVSGVMDRDAVAGTQQHMYQTLKVRPKL